MNKLKEMKHSLDIMLLEIDIADLQIEQALIPNKIDRLHKQLELKKSEPYL